MIILSISFAHYSNTTLQTIYQLLFHLSSMSVTLVVNSVLLVLFVKHSFQYHKFEKWFWNHSGIIIFLMSFCFLTDVVMVIPLFTSQIFGHLIFYAPFNVLDIKKYQKCIINFHFC